MTYMETESLGRLTGPEASSPQWLYALESRKSHICLVLALEGTKQEHRGYRTSKIQGLGAPWRVTGRVCIATLKKLEPNVHRQWQEQKTHPLQ